MSGSTGTLYVQADREFTGDVKWGYGATSAATTVLDNFAVFTPIGVPYKRFQLEWTFYNANGFVRNNYPSAGMWEDLMLRLFMWGIIVDGDSASFPPILPELPEEEPEP